MSAVVGNANAALAIDHDHASFSAGPFKPFNCALSSHGGRNGFKSLHHRRRQNGSRYALFITGKGGGPVLVIGKKAAAGKAGTAQERKSVVWGRSGSARRDIVGARTNKT